MWIRTWLGTYTNCTDELKWVDKLKVLGVYFGNDATNANWNKRTVALKKITNLWLQRDLTVKGRVIITDVLGLSKFYYTAKVLIPPASIITKIRKILINFFGMGKAHLVSQEVCLLPYKQGGLGLTDFDTTLNALY